MHVFNISLLQIADEMKPHPVVIKILNKLAGVIPTWRIIPTQDIIDIAFKKAEKREEVTLQFTTNFSQSIGFSTNQFDTMISGENRSGPILTATRGGPV